MAIDDTVAVRASRIIDDANEPHSAAWWEQRTAEELRDIIKRGFAGGQAFRNAVAEAERRARIETKRLREVAAIESDRRNKRNRIILGIAGGAAAIAVTTMWLFA